VYRAVCTPVRASVVFSTKIVTFTHTWR
jgi:hypothetical protein